MNRHMARDSQLGTPHSFGFAFESLPASTTSSFDLRKIARLLLLGRGVGEVLDGRKGGCERHLPTFSRSGSTGRYSGEPIARRRH